MEMSMFYGLLNNVLITAGSCLLPTIVGIATYFVCGKNETLTQLARLCGVLFESFCPVLTIILMYYCFFAQIRLNGNWVCIIGFSISFLGYMPTRYNSNYSFFKNVAVNGIGLVSSIFKWSFCAGFIGAVEMLYAARMQMSITFNTSSFWTAMIISFAVLLILELMKYVVKEKL